METDSKKNMEKSSAAGKNNLKKGVLCMMTAGLGFSAMSLFVRMSGDLPVYEKAFFRNAVAVIVSVYILIKRGEFGEIKKLNKTTIPALFVRCAAGTAGIFFNFMAIDRIALADANMLNKTSPIFALLFTALLLKDIPGKTDVICTVIALIGVVFVVKPGSSLFQIGALMGLMGGVGAGLAYSCVRYLGTHRIKGEIIVAAFSLFSCLCSIPLIIADPVAMEFKQVIYLILAGVGATIGQLFITAAYTYAPPKDVSIYDYLQVVYAAILAFAIWGEVPDIFSIFGYIIIIGIAAVQWRIKLKS